MHGGRQGVAASRDQVCARDLGGVHRRQSAGHHGVAALGAAHGLYHVAEKAGMEVAEEAQKSAIPGSVHQHLRQFGFCHGAFGGDLRAGVVHRLEVAAVELDAPVFPGEYRVGLGAGGDQNRPRGQHGFGSIGAFHPQCRGMSETVGVNGNGRKTLGEANGFFHRFRHFLVVQRVGRAIGQLAAVGDGRAAPGVQQLGNAEGAVFVVRRLAFGADGSCMGEEFIGGFGFFGGPCGSHRGLAPFAHQQAVARGELLHLPHVVGEAFGRRIDRRKPAADHHHRQADLQVGDGGHLGRAGQLQRHQEVGRLPHPARQPVGDVQHGGFAGAHAQRDVVEAHRPGVVHGNRRAAAEPHAAEMGEIFRPALQQQAHQLEVVLVPAHGDAVLRDAAEAGQHAIVEVFE